MIDMFLNPGQVFAGDHRHRVHTLLGSCVSVTLWAPARRVGAMSHYLLADGPQVAGRAPDPRYGGDALELMCAALAARGVDPRGCEAKVFGGADMGAGDGAVGRRNGELALRRLRAAGIGVRATSLYGRGHRRIVFDIATGDVWSREGAVA